MKIPVKIDGLSLKEDLEACWLDGGRGGDGSSPRDKRSD